METADVQAKIESALIPLIKALVDKPSEVKVDLFITVNATVIININVDKSDTGKIIGREGRHADAIRTLVKAIAAGMKHRAVIEITE